MQLLCSNSKRIAIYSAMYGRSQRGTLECPVTDAAEDTGVHNLSNITLAGRESISFV